MNNDKLAPQPAPPIDRLKLEVNNLGDIGADVSLHACSNCSCYCFADPSFSPCGGSCVCFTDE